MIRTLLKSTRITWSSKNANMYVLALSYAVFSNIIISNPLSILEGLILVSLLWGALYSLNDLTDLNLDRLDKRKQERAFIQEKVEKRYIILFCSVILILVFSISLLTMNIFFTLILALMLLNQLLYTLPPIRLKDTVLAPFTSTATNSVLRISSCCVIIGNLFLVPVSVYLFMFTAGMGTYAMYKEKNRASTIIGVIASIILLYIFYVGDMNFIQFCVAILPSVIATIPLYFSLFMRKEQMLSWADKLYHKVALIFFWVIILFILFLR